MSNREAHCEGLFQLGDFLFVPSTGELVNRLTEQRAKLAPMPAQLLLLLIENKGDLVSHSDIQECLWPDSVVEYKQSIHYCIRQIRIAIDDSAKPPIYIENIPKRGYRLIAPVVSVETSGSIDDSESEETRAAECVAQRDWGFNELTKFAALVAFAVASVVMTGYVQSRAGRHPARSDAPPVAINPVAYEPLLLSINHTPNESESRSASLLDSISDELAGQIISRTHVTLISRSPGTESSYTASSLPGEDYALDIFVARDNGADVLRARVLHRSRGMVWAQQWELDAEPRFIYDGVVDAINRLQLQTAV